MTEIQQDSWMAAAKELVDLYNLFNSNTGTAFNQDFGVDGVTWMRPTAVLSPRFLRFNVTFDF